MVGRRAVVGLFCAAVASTAIGIVAFAPAYAEPEAPEAAWEGAEGWDEADDLDDWDDLEDDEDEDWDDEWDEPFDEMYADWYAEQRRAEEAASVDGSADGPEAVQDAEGSAAAPEPVIVRVEGAGGVSVPQRDIAEAIRAVKEADPDAQVVCVVLV